MKKLNIEQINKGESDYSLSETGFVVLYEGEPNKEVRGILLGIFPFSNEIQRIGAHIRAKILRKGLP